MVSLGVLVLMLGMVGGSDAAWCVCKGDQSTSVLQKALDYACGAGADCSPILQNGACYNPNTVVAHCSYAVNSYFQRKGQVQGACDFAGAAMLSPSDPFPGGSCTFPATPSAAGTSNSSSMTPGFTPSPVTGGGFGPSPSVTNNFDGSGGGSHPKAKMGSLLACLLSGLILWEI